MQEDHQTAVLRLLRQLEAEVRSGQRRVEVAVDPRDRGMRVEFFVSSPAGSESQPATC